jgi:hypothetical protein
LTALTYQLAGFIIFDMAEVETLSCPATSAKAIPCIFTSPIAIRARTLLASLRRLPPFNSSIDTFSFHLELFPLIRHVRSSGNDPVGLNF